MTLQDVIHALKDKCKDDYLMHLQKLKDSQETIQEIFDALEYQSDSELCNSICEAFFVIYTYKIGSESHSICSQFIPAVIWTYFCQLSNEGKNQSEALLLAIYNQCVDRNIETPYANSFRLPSISKSSVFHEPMLSSLHSALTENALNQHEKADKPIFYKGPTNYLDHIPTGLRSTVIATVLQEFNFSLSSYLRPTLLSLCHLVIRISLSGYNNTTDVVYGGISPEHLRVLSSHHKIRLSGKCVQEFVTSLQFAAFNGLYEESRIALKCLHQHCSYSLSFAGTLSTNALLDVLQLSAEEKDTHFEITPPVDPKRCGYRGKGKSSMINSQRPMFPQSLSIDRILLTDDSVISLNPTKSMVSPSNISIQIDSPSTPPSSSTFYAELENIGGKEAVKSELFKENTNDVLINKRSSSSYIDDDSEIDTDKTPLINGNVDEQEKIQQENNTVIVEIVKNRNTTSHSPKNEHEETKM